MPHFYISHSPIFTFPISTFSTFPHFHILSNFPHLLEPAIVETQDIDILVLVEIGSTIGGQGRSEFEFIQHLFWWVLAWRILPAGKGRL